MVRVSNAESDSRQLLPAGPYTPGILGDSGSRGGAPSVTLTIPEARGGPRTTRIVAEIRDIQRTQSVILELNWTECDRIVIAGRIPIA